VTEPMATTQTSTTEQRMGSRQKVNVPARLTWRDARGTLRFSSVVMRDVSEVDAFVECQVPASIPLYRLVQLQIELAASQTLLPQTMRGGKVLSAVYRLGPRQSSTGTPSGYALRLLIDPQTARSAGNDAALAVAN